MKSSGFHPTLRRSGFCMLFFSLINSHSLILSYSKRTTPSFLTFHKEELHTYYGPGLMSGSRGLADMVPTCTRLPDPLGRHASTQGTCLCTPARSHSPGAMGRAHHQAATEPFCGHVTSKLRREVSESAQCSGEAWAEGTVLAKTQKGDRAWRFGKVKMNTRSSSIGWIAGLFFHLFIHSFNKNPSSVYSCQALWRPWKYKHAVLFRESTAFGIWGGECC